VLAATVCRRREGRRQQPRGHPGRHAHRRAREHRHRPLRIRRVRSSRLPAPAPAHSPRLLRIQRDHRLWPSRCPRPPGPRAISISRHALSRAPGPV